MEAETLAKICKALGDNNRMAIIQMLAEENLCATDILSRLDITQPTLSHHMKQLTDSGLVLARKEKTMTYYSLSPECVADIRKSLDRVFPASDGRNLSEQEQNYEEKLMAIAREERKENAAKSDFLIRMSHNLRTSITGIKGMLLMAKKAEGNYECGNDYLGKISDATDRLEEMVNEIIDISNLENDKDALVVESFNVFDTAREINNELGPRMKKAGVRFKTEARGEIKHPFILTSRVYVKRIFEIILENALKYNQKDDEIAVTFEEVSHTEEETTHRITITDTGTAADDERKEAYGAAIGLSVVKRFVDRINGGFRVQSEPGKGTCITTEMTFKIDKRAGEQQANRQLTGISGKRVLLVEDNDLNMEVAEFILKDAGASVVCAINGKEAVDIIRTSAEGEFDVILMDIVMPVMDGCEATRVIRGMQRNDTARIPIIAMSANAFDKDIKTSFDAGMNEYITKPLNVGGLMATLEKWITKGKSTGTQGGL